MTDRLLTAREVAEFLAMSTESVLRRWRRGELPGFRLASNVLRFRESEIETWLNGLKRIDSVRTGSDTPANMPAASLPPTGLDRG